MSWGEVSKGPVKYKSKSDDEDNSDTSDDD